MEKEIWKPAKYIKQDGTVIDFSKQYEVSNTNKFKILAKINARNLHRKEKIRDFNIIHYKNKYVTLNLYDNNGKRYNCTFHRLVLSTFNSDSDVYSCVDHIDGNPENSNLNNLRWSSYSENSKNPNTNKPKTEEHKKKISDSHKGKKLSDLHKQNISKGCSKTLLQFSKEDIFIKEWKSAVEVEKTFGWFATCINACCRGKRKTAYGYKWKYKNAA